MRSRIRGAALTGMALALAGIGMVGIAPPASAAATDARTAQPCDRACLKGYMTRYLAALAAKDPSRLPTSPRTRFTENGVAIPLGEALWYTITALGSYRSDYVDTGAGQIASVVTFVENDKPGIMSVRLRVEGGVLTEIETVLNRNNKNAAAMLPPDPIWEEIEPASSRLSREELARGAEGYMKAVAENDSRHVRFNEKSCIRFENSSVMALAPGDTPPGPTPSNDGTDNWLNIIADTLRIGCGPQIDTGVYSFITSYNNARFPVIDEERQVVFAQFNFRRAGKIQGIDYKGKHYSYFYGMQFPNENLLGEAFKFRDGGITRVQGVFLNGNVYKTGTGWDVEKN